MPCALAERARWITDLAAYCSSVECRSSCWHNPFPSVTRLYWVNFPSCYMAILSPDRIFDGEGSDESNLTVTDEGRLITMMTRSIFTTVQIQTRPGSSNQARLHALGKSPSSSFSCPVFVYIIKHVPSSIRRNGNEGSLPPLRCMSPKENKKLSASSWWLSAC